MLAALRVFERLQPLVAQLVEVFDAALRVITSSGELILLEGAVGQLLPRVREVDSTRFYRDDALASEVSRVPSSSSSSSSNSWKTHTAY